MRGGGAGPRRAEGIRARAAPLPPSALAAGSAEQREGCGR